MRWFKEEKAFPLPGSLGLSLPGRRVVKIEDFFWVGSGGSCGLETHFNNIMTWMQVLITMGPFG